MEKDTVVILGSGATRGGGFKVQVGKSKIEPPLDNDFFGEEIKRLACKKYPALSYYEPEGSLENSWANIDLVGKLCLGKVISEEHAWGSVKKKMNEKAESDSDYKNKMGRECSLWCVPSMAGWELRALVLEVYGTLNLEEERECSPLWQVVDKIQERLLGVISFNYDTSLEMLFDGSNKFYYPILEEAQGRLPLMKLHGSLNWQYSNLLNGQLIEVKELGVVKMCHSGNEYAQPEIIGPTFFKQEIALDFQKDYRARYYKNLWRCTWELLKNTRKLVFIGFSFPLTDSHAAALFRSAGLSGHGFQSVFGCYKEENKESENNLKKRITEVFQRQQERPEHGWCECGVEGLAGQIGELIQFLMK